MLPTCEEETEILLSFQFLFIIIINEYISSIN